MPYKIGMREKYLTIT